MIVTHLRYRGQDDLSSARVALRAEWVRIPGEGTEREHPRLDYHARPYGSVKKVMSDASLV